MLNLMLNYYVKLNVRLLCQNFLLHSFKAITPAAEVKNLCVTFDSENTFDSYVGKVCHACYYHLQDLHL